LLVKLLSDAISVNIILPLMEKVLGRDIPSDAEMRRRQQQVEQVRSSKGSAAEEASQTTAEASVPPLNATDVAVQAIEDLVPL